MRRCGANARSAARCSTGATWRQISTSARAAATIFAWAPTIASASIADGEFTEIGARSRARRSARMVGQKVVSREAQRRSRAQRHLRSGLCGFATIGGFPVALGVMDFHFRGGTMGAVTANA